MAPEDSIVFRGTSNDAGSFIESASDPNCIRDEAILENEKVDRSMG